MLTARQRYTRAAAVSIIAAAFLILYIQVVNLTGFMPRCIIKWATGWSCPGCGSQRAFMALLHGHPSEALEYNPILLPALMYLSILAAGYLMPEKRIPARLYRGATSPATLIVVAATTVGWMVLRNIIGI